MQRLRRLLAAAAALIACATSAYALDIPARPSPGVRVVDQAKVLSASERQQLESQIKALENKTTAQVVVLTIPSLKGDDIFDFTQRTFDSWKPGQKGTDNGLLIVLALQERKLRVHTGYGLEGPIPDATALDLGQLMKGHLKKGQEKYFLAFTSGVEGVARLINGESISDPKKRKGDPRWSLFIVPLILAGFIAMFDVWQARLAAGAVCSALSGGIAWYVLAAPMPHIALALLIGFLIGMIADFIWRIGFDVGGAVLGGGSSGGGGASVDF